MMTVNVYSRPGCLPCERTKRLLAEGGVRYNDLNVEDDPAAADTVRQLGYASVPVVTADLPDGMDHWSGYRRENIDALVYLFGSGRDVS